MKKYVSILTIAAFALMVATPALAHDKDNNSNRGGELRGKARAEVRANTKSSLIDKLKIRFGEDKFVIGGTVTAVSSASISVNVSAGAHVDSWINKVAIVAIDADTDFHIKNSKNAEASGIKVGDKVLIKGEIKDGTTFEANDIHVINRDKAMGTVTATTDTSVTIKNSVTGVEKTVAIDPETEIKINGETQAAADIQVGDKGWVKFKTKVDVTVAKIINLFR